MALAAKVKKFWNETFVLPDSGKTCNADGTLCDTQCSYAIALSYGVAEDRKRIGEHLIRKTRAIGHTVGTGFFGTGILNQMLTEQGAVEDAWKMMLQTAFPSWLYPVTQGATTIWEHWDSYTKEKGFGGQNAMNSFNHYSLGSVLSWLYHTGLGIQFHGIRRILRVFKQGCRCIDRNRNLILYFVTFPLPSGRNHAVRAVYGTFHKLERARLRFEVEGFNGTKGQKP